MEIIIEFFHVLECFTQNCIKPQGKYAFCSPTYSLNPVSIENQVVVIRKRKSSTSRMPQKCKQNIASKKKCESYPCGFVSKAIADERTNAFAMTASFLFDFALLRYGRRRKKEKTVHNSILSHTHTFFVHKQQKP